MARAANTPAVPVIGVLGDDEKFTATPAFVDAQGDSVALADLAKMPDWASADSTKVGVIAAADGSAEIDGLAVTGSNPDGTPAVVLVTCTGTNKDGTTAVLTGAIQVHAGAAVGGGLVFGAPSKR